MITDATFQVESEYTCAAVKTSQALQEWWLESENREHLSWFAHILIVRLQTCFCCKHSTKKQKMWRSFQTIRTSDTFVKDWKVFILQSVNLKAFPAFYQFITDYIFTELIKLEFSIQRGEDDTESSIMHRLSLKVTFSSQQEKDAFQDRLDAGKEATFS